MYDEVLQLMSLVKNDELFHKRIEELKAKQLELAQVMEIAKSVKEADMYLANARQRADEIIKEAESKAEEIKDEATLIVAENRATLQKNKEKQAELKAKESDLAAARAGISNKEKELDAAIEEHRKLTAMRNDEYEASVKVRTDFENKLRKMKELANS